MMIVKGGFNPGGVAHTQNHVLAWIPGSDTCYIPQQNIDIVEQAQVWMKETSGISLSAAADNLDSVSKVMLSCWIRQLPVLRQVREEEREIGCYHQCTGHFSQLSNMHSDMLKNTI